MRPLGLMKTYAIRANVRVDSRVKDRDAWAVDLIEGSDLSEELKAGRFWATWPDRVELVFSVRADENSIEEIHKGDRVSGRWRLERSGQAATDGRREIHQ